VTELLGKADRACTVVATQRSSVGEQPPTEQVAALVWVAEWLTGHK